ncbi:MAG: phage tail protein [Candidatus Acidiferrales bacterium]
MDIIATVAMTVVSALLAPHPHLMPSALGDFSVPTAQEGRAIPVIFGTVMIRGGNTVWWGDLATRPVHQQQNLLSTIMSFGLGSNQVIGYKYFLGLQFCLCHGPVDALIGIQADVRAVSYTATTKLNGNGTENYIELDVESPDLFGGTTVGGGGGIQGIVNFYRGLQTQLPDSYLTAKQGRVVVDSSGLGDTFSGAGNGTLSFLSGGSASRNETITITCKGVNSNSLDPHGHFQKAFFKVVGTVSGTLADTSSGDAGGCWADTAFTDTRINFTVTTGGIQFSTGDFFTVKTENSLAAPSYKGICYAVFKQLYMGTSSYLKPMAFIVQRCPDPFAQGASVAKINADGSGADANPALAVYDLLTNTIYGLGRAPSRFDVNSFKNGAIALAAEGLGISMQIDSQGSADQLIGEMLRHMDGIVYTDPATGLWTLKLARADYDPATLPILTVDNVLETPEFSRSSWLNTTNEVDVKFLARASNFNTRIVRAYDPANIAVTGAVRPQALDFNGLSNPAAASLVAMRALKTFTFPLSVIKIVANRTAWQFRPGGLFKFTWVPLGVQNQIFRITKIEYGDLTEGKITIQAVEDIFGISNAAFVAPPTSGWVNPLGLPAAPAAEQLIEAPYHFLTVAGLAPGIYAMGMCARGDGTSKSFEIWLNEGSGDFLSNEIFSFAPAGLLSAVYGAGTPAIDATGFTLQPTSQEDLQFLISATAADLPNGLNLLLIDAELMSWETVTANSDGTFTISSIMRGVADTVPVNHPTGARAWFFTAGGAGYTKGQAYPADLTVSAKLLPKNAAGTFPIGSASSVTVLTRSRYARPYPPGDLTMQAQPYGTRYSTVTGDLVVVWKSRNRLTQTAAGTLVKQDAGDVTPEIGTTYTVQIFLGATLIRTVTGIAVETYTYTAAQRVADGADGTQAVTIEIFANANSLDSFMPNQLTATMTGFGMDFGNFFGGLQA